MLFSAPSRGGRAAPSGGDDGTGAKRAIRWADEDSTVYSTEDGPADAAMDMFASGGQEGSALPITEDLNSLPFHLRVKRELEEYPRRRNQSRPPPFWHA